MFGFLDRLRGSPHRWCQNNLSAYIDRELSARDHERVRRHLEACADCRRDLQGMERTVALLRQLPQVRAPRSFYIPEAAPAPSLPVWMRPWAYGALRTATAAVAVLFVVTVAGNALAMPGYLRPAAQFNAVSTEHAPAPAAAGQDVGAAEAATPAGELLAAPAPTNEEPTLTPEEAARATAAPVGRGMGPEPEDVPTLTAEEAARATAAPLGLGGGAETVTPPPVSAEALPSAEPPPEAPLAAAPAEPTTQTQAAKASTEPTVPARVVEDGAEAGPEVAGDTYGASGVIAARYQLSRYPWRLWAAATAALLAVLAAATLWLRAARARWP